MKLFLLILLLITLNSRNSYSQQQIDTSIRTALRIQLKKGGRDNMPDHLFILGKVWGLLKYYHPAIAAGKYNWDEELLRLLPAYCRISSPKERSDTLEAWLDKFGEVPACASCTDSVLKNAKLAPDFSWIDQSGFSKQLSDKLKYIVKNRIQSGQYYIRPIFEDGVSFVFLQHENAYFNMVYPNDGYALLAVFRFWNVIEYWYPYKYNLPVNWNTILKQFVVKILTHENVQQYTLTLEELAAAIHDSHGYVASVAAKEVAGKYYMPFTVKIIEGQLFVTAVLNDSLARLADVQVGDIIEKTDGVTVNDRIKQLTPYYPASNRRALLNTLGYWLVRTPRTQSNLVIKRNGKVMITQTTNYIPSVRLQVNLDPPYFTYAKDSAFCMLPNNIGYINVGLFKRKDSLALKELVSKTTSLIIDNRQNQDEQHGTGGGDIIANLVSSTDNFFVKFTVPQPLYPGVFSFSAPVNMGINASNQYKGKIVVLANEQTISVGEFLTMAFRKAPRAIILGTATAGADGNANDIVLPGGVKVAFTGLGVYYPDGRETQRVGIQPDVVVKQTLRGYQQKKDEQLDRAIDYLRKS